MQFTEHLFSCYNYNLAFGWVYRQTKPRNPAPYKFQIFVDFVKIVKKIILEANLLQ